MNNAVASLRAIGPCLLAAGLGQLVVCRLKPGDYAEGTLWLFAGGWAIGSLVLDWFERRLFFAYLGSVALAAPGISYSMLGYGGLEMAGWFHAFAVGLWSLPFYFIFRQVRARKQKDKPVVGPEPPRVPDQESPTQ